MPALRTALALLRTIACVLVLPPLVLLYSVGAILTVLATGSTRASHAWYRSFAAVSLALAGTRIEVHGGEHLAPGQAYVIVSNHESNWDPPCIVAALPPLVTRFVAKRQLAAIPIFGTMLRVTGNIIVDRRSGGTDVRRVQSGMSQRDPNVSILFFAEGTRTRDGRFGPFKMGAFVTALAFGLPILPIAIAGTRRVWHPGSKWIESGPVVVEVGDPIHLKSTEEESSRALRDRVHRAVAELRTRARTRLRDRGIDPTGVD
jgi:1-acyl-sn-glycerol-3-phosphate acyltransferase